MQNNTHTHYQQRKGEDNEDDVFSATWTNKSCEAGELSSYQQTTTPPPPPTLRDRDTDGDREKKKKDD